MALNCHVRGSYMLPVVIPCLEEGICRDCPLCPTDKNAAQKDDFAAKDSEEEEEQDATGGNNGFSHKADYIP